MKVLVSTRFVRWGRDDQGGGGWQWPIQDLKGAGAPQGGLYMLMEYGDVPRFFWVLLRNF